MNADALLAAMNARTTIVGRRSARVRMGIWTPHGWIRRPLLTMHSTLDGTARTANESAFRDRVARFGNDDHLAQVFTAAPGHGSFSATQLLDVLAAMEQWLDAGEKPESRALPDSARVRPGLRPGRVAVLKHCLPGSRRGSPVG